MLLHRSVSLVIVQSKGTNVGEGSDRSVSSTLSTAWGKAQTGMSPQRSPQPGGRLRPECLLGGLLGEWGSLVSFVSFSVKTTKEEGNKVGGPATASCDAHEHCPD